MAILDQIKRIRDKGLYLAEDGLFVEASEKHSELIALVEENPKDLEGTGITPDDIYTLAYAEQAFCSRKNDDGTGATESVNVAVDHARGAATFSAAGRAHEEAGLVARLVDYNHIDATDHIETAIGKYEASMLPGEVGTREELVMDREERQSRLLRSYGLLAVSLRDLSRQEEGDERRSSLEKALVYAKKETDGREELEDVVDSNAYHTEGAIQSELILVTKGEEREAMLKAARETLTVAKSNAMTPNEVANINYAIFTVERNYSPDSTQTIEAYKNFLTTMGDLSAADVREFRDQQGLYDDARKTGFLKETQKIVEEKLQ